MLGNRSVTAIDDVTVILCNHTYLARLRQLLHMYGMRLPMYNGPLMIIIHHNYIIMMPLRGEVSVPTSSVVHAILFTTSVLVWL